MIEVSNADQTCNWGVNGLYKLDTSLSVTWSPERPVYRHMSSDKKVIFWYPNGGGWAISSMGAYGNKAIGAYYFSEYNIYTFAVKTQIITTEMAVFNHLF
jgi:hypothetical protein